MVTTEPNLKKIHRGKRKKISIYFLTRSCDAMYRMRESKSKLELFYQLFIEFFVIHFLALGLNTCLNGI